MVTAQPLKGKPYNLIIKHRLKNKQENPGLKLKPKTHVSQIVSS